MELSGATRPPPGLWADYPRPAVSERGSPPTREQREQGWKASKWQRDRDWQNEQAERTGFVQQSETGNATFRYLRRRGYSHARAKCGAQLAAVSSQWNYQGTARIAELAQCSPRTCQRAVADLTADGLLESFLLGTGDRLPMQRAAAWHPQVSRRVALLQWYGRHGLGVREPMPERSAAHMPQAERDQRDARVRNLDPEFAAYIPAVYAGNVCQQVSIPDPAPAPYGCPEQIDPSEIDEWDRVTEALERGPPGRAPPVQD